MIWSLWHFVSSLMLFVWLPHLLNNWQTILVDNQPGWLLLFYELLILLSLPPVFLECLPVFSLPRWPASLRPESRVCCHGATGGRIMSWWGCHSNHSEEKSEGGDLALGHPHPSWSLSVALWQVSSYRGPAGQIDNSMSSPVPGFYKHHFTASVFVWQTPCTTQYPLLHHPQTLFFLFPLFFPSTKSPCLTTVLSPVVLVWDGL